MPADDPKLVRMHLDVTVQTGPGPHGEPWWVALRQALKRLLRNYGMRCTAIYGVRRQVDHPGEDCDAC